MRVVIMLSDFKNLLLYYSGMMTRLLHNDIMTKWYNDTKMTQWYNVIMTQWNRVEDGIMQWHSFGVFMIFIDGARHYE